MNLALFDFDGTLTKKDTLNEFLKYYFNKRFYLKKMVIFLPIFILYKLKIIKNSIAKERLLKLFFKEVRKDEFQKKAIEFSLNKIDLFLKNKVYKKLKVHQKNGDRVIIVSASMRCWLQPWTKKEGVELISTELKFVDDKFVGKFATKNCYGEEKVDRIKKYLNLDDFDKIYAYGDSKGDKEMFGIADFWEKV